MSSRRDIQGEMRNLLLDRETADRLLTGRVDPDDAPPGYARVAVLLRAASSFPPADPGREQATVSVMVEEIRSHLEVEPAGHQRRSMKGLVRAKIVAVAVGVTLAGTTSLAFAGALPGAAQGVAQTMLAKVGITLPGPNPHAGTHPDTPGSFAPASPALGGSRPSVDPSNQVGHGQAGQPHGQAGQPHGQAGQPHGQAGQPHGQAGQPHGQAGQSHDRSGQPHGQSLQSDGNGNRSIRSERRR
jgi:hypothetical protein